MGGGEGKARARGEEVKMKFLCIRCDEPMKFVKAESPENGSVSLLFGCEKCNNQIAMLTNPQETQLVRTLGVSIGGGAAVSEPLTLTKNLMSQKSHQRMTILYGQRRQRRG